MMNTPPPQQHEALAQIEKSSDNENENEDYLQVLDAGEHMFGMFVANNVDLYAYLGAPEEPMWNICSSAEDIEDVISRSIGPGNGLDAMHLELSPFVDNCCCSSFADMHIRGKVGAGEAQGGNNDPNDSTNTGRITPTRNETDDHDAMSE